MTRFAWGRVIKFYFSYFMVSRGRVYHKNRLASLGSIIAQTQTTCRAIPVILCTVLVLDCPIWSLTYVLRLSKKSTSFLSIVALRFQPINTQQQQKKNSKMNKDPNNRETCSWVLFSPLSHFFPLSNTLVILSRLTYYMHRQARHWIVDIYYGT